MVVGVLGLSTEAWTAVGSLAAVATLGMSVVSWIQRETRSHDIPESESDGEGAVG
ncbi:MAG TPA: hypothetical protein VI111_03155 [Thermoleophilaceae bacterium]